MFMPPTFHEIASSVIGRSVDYMGENFEFQSQTYKGVINEGQASQDGEMGGFRDSYAMTIYVRKTGFPVPTIGQKLTARGKVLRIVQVQSDAISYSLVLEDPNK